MKKLRTMENFNEHIQQRQAGRFYFEKGKVMNEVFQLWPKVTAPIAVAYLILFVIIVAIIAASFNWIYGVASFQEFMELGKDPEAMKEMQQDMGVQLRGLFVGFAVMLISTPLSAGVMRYCRSVDKEGEGHFGQLFSYYRGPYWFRIIAVSFIIALISSLVRFALSPLGYTGTGLYLFVVLALNTLTCYVMPLIIFADVSLGRAFSISYKAAGARFSGILLLWLLFGFLSLLGAIVCGIGIIFTMSFQGVFLYLLYKEGIGFPEDQPVAEEAPEENG